MTETSLMILEHDKALGRIFVESGFFADVKKESEAIVKMLAGREVGLKPIEAMTGIHIIKGKITFGANMMAAAVKGSERYDYRVTKHTATECVIDFYQNEHGQKEKIGTSSFTIEEAKQIGLTSNSTWKNYPKAMLFARALSSGVRYYCPDVFGHSPVYVPEEMGAEVDEDGEPIDITPNPIKTPIDSKEPQELREIPNNPMPYLKNNDTPTESKEMPFNGIVLPTGIMSSIIGATARDAFEIVDDFTFKDEQGPQFKAVVVRHYREYFEKGLAKWQIPESALINIVRDASGITFPESEKSVKCKVPGCENQLTAPEAEKRDNLCREHFKGDTEDE